MRNKKQGYAYQHKPVEELTFTDDFMFGRVLRARLSARNFWKHCSI